MDESEMVTIPRAEYKRLLSAEARLDALYQLGLKDWSGYELAIECFSLLDPDTA